jgi:hypothetical protein
MIKHFIIFCIALFINLLPGHSQNNVTARITIIRNSRVEFHFNSLYKFEHGIQLKDWTEIKVYYNDTITGGIENPTTGGWELDVRANNIALQPDYGINTLPLNTIQISCHYDGSDHGPFDLESSDVEIASGTSGLNVTKSILITYECGMVPGRELMYYESDFFYTDLIFTIKSKD